MRDSILVHSNFQVNILGNTLLKIALHLKGCKIFGIRVRTKTRDLTLNSEFFFAMDQLEKDAGTISALILRMEETRLPRARRLHEHVTAGEMLSDSDIRFLRRVHDDYQANQALMLRNPDYAHLMACFMDLYAEIVARGFENEKAR